MTSQISHTAHGDAPLSAAKNPDPQAEGGDVALGDVAPGDGAVWGCGPVGLFAVQSAIAQRAHRVIAIDHYAHRLDLAKSLGAEVINFEEVDVREALVEMTGGIGPDACIDPVGMESHGSRPTASWIRSKRPRSW